MTLNTQFIYANYGSFDVRRTVDKDFFDRANVIKELVMCREGALDIQGLSREDVCEITYLTACYR